MRHCASSWISKHCAITSTKPVGISAQVRARLGDDGRRLAVWLPLDRADTGNFEERVPIPEVRSKLPEVRGNGEIKRFGCG
jgi:hypothetical protein